MTFYHIISLQQDLQGLFLNLAVSLQALLFHCHKLCVCSLYGLQFLRQINLNQLEVVDGLSFGLNFRLSNVETNEQATFKMPSHR